MHSDAMFDMSLNSLIGWNVT